AAGVLVALPIASAATPPPKSTSPPTISGTPQVGQTLTAGNGSWSGKPTRYTYQWRRCDSSGNNCNPISAATSSTYTATSNDLGNALVATVTALNSGGSATAVSAPTAVELGRPSGRASAAAPTIAGTPQAEQTHTAGNGSQNGTQPISYTYQWQRCDSSGNNCNPISAATSSTYTATSNDLGNALVATVTALNSGGSATAVSAPTAVVTALPSTTYYVDCQGSDSNDG